MDLVAEAATGFWGCQCDHGHGVTSTTTPQKSVFHIVNFLIVTAQSERRTVLPTLCKYFLVSRTPPINSIDLYTSYHHDMHDSGLLHSLTAHICISPQTITFPPLFAWNLGTALVYSVLCPMNEHLSYPHIDDSANVRAERDLRTTLGLVLFKFANLTQWHYH